MALLGWAVAIARAVRSSDGWDEWADSDDDYAPQPARDDDELENESPAARSRRRPTGRRVAASVTFATLFFGGAAFTAGAGDMVAKALDPVECAALMQATGEGEDVCARVEQEQTLEAAPSLESAPAEPAPVESAPAPEAPAPAPEDAQAETPDDVVTETEAPSAAEGELTASAPESAAPEQAAPEAQPDATTNDDPLVLAPDAQTEAAAAAAAKGPKTRHWVVRRARETKQAAPAIEHEGGQPTVWLNRVLPDPTPPAKRLSPAFAKTLQRISAVNGVHWSLVLGVLRAEGARDRVPATVRELSTLARGLNKHGASDSEWNAVLSLSGRSTFADRAVALARYNRAVGLQSLVEGLEASKGRLATQLLTDERVQVYGGGRDDVLEGRIDVRVIVMIQYLAESYGQVGVTSLFSGHRKYSRPGVISAHIYGHAVDIASVGGISIYGNSGPGGITEKAVRSILALPVEVQPRQVISLLGLGGASFPLADHADHIHVGY